uniref:Uncharacterized protein n=1 Tax=Romanomermis culicivorax TaxID=13658 RepID=A0A915L3S8_ROMCU
MHSAIEFAKREQNIYSLECWATILRMACCKKPYKVKVMSITDFFDLKALASTFLTNRTKDENGEVVNWFNIIVPSKNVVTYYYKNTAGNVQAEIIIIT